MVEQQGFDNFTKAGFARLLKHFENNTDDVVKLTRAFALANKAHRGQHSSAGDSEPHINHSLRVALILAEEFQVRDCDLVAAALLHDSLESGLPEADIVAECGDKVAATVRLATEPPKGKAEEYFARLAKEPREARLVKLAERLEMARSLKNHAYRDRALRYKEETQKYVVPLAQGTDERFAFKLSVALYEIK
ncbi:HD domain-containing protein [Nitrososphaera sp.]|uniref:HD domain-containing protein n=1 Tax=Nitrososphaera sp. TaxID=1971748 RepID=UPI00307FBDFA